MTNKGQILCKGSKRPNGSERISGDKNKAKALLDFKNQRDELRKQEQTCGKHEEGKRRAKSRAANAVNVSNQKQNIYERICKSNNPLMQMDKLEHGNVLVA